MKPKTEEFKTAISQIRERISLTKRQNTSRGFIGYSGCSNVCREFDHILEMANQAANVGNFAFAYAIVSLIQINLARLASTADDSAGGITNTGYYLEEVLEKICSGVEPGSDEAKYIYLSSCKDALNKAFEGWLGDFEYPILIKTARLAEVKNQAKMLEVLNVLKEKSKRESGYLADLDAQVRLGIIKATQGSEAVQTFIEQNLHFESIRKLAVERALEDNDYAKAEQLCLDILGANLTQRGLGKASDWKYLLFNVYDQAKNLPKKIEVAKNLLFCYDLSYYDIHKNLLIESEKWEESYDPLLAELELNMTPNAFMQLLAKEQEISKLLQTVRKNPSYVFNYGKLLAEQFPQETYAICLNAIKTAADEATDRRLYKKVTKLIKELFDFGGKTEAQEIINQLIEDYPRRTAMVDELQKLKTKLS